MAGKAGPSSRPNDWRGAFDVGRWYGDLLLAGSPGTVRAGDGCCAEDGRVLDAARTGPWTGGAGEWVRSSAGPRLRAAWATSRWVPAEDAGMTGWGWPGRVGCLGVWFDTARRRRRTGSPRTGVGHVGLLAGHLWSGRASAWVRVVDLMVMAVRRSGTGSGRVVRGVKVRLSVSSRAGSARSWT